MCEKLLPKTLAVANRSIIEPQQKLNIARTKSSFAVKITEEFPFCSTEAT